MAGKKRAATASTASTKKTGTKRAAAAKKCLQVEKQTKKTKIGPAARDDGNEKYHILRLIPIRQDECIALLKTKGVDCSGDACDDSQKLGNAFTLKLPLNCQDIADDFFDDYSSDNEYTEQSKKPDFIRYYRPNNGPYSVVIKLGRFQINSHKQELSRELCYIGLTDNGEAWISMRQKPGDHGVHIDGKIIQDCKGLKLFALHNGTVLSFFYLNFAYRIEIESSVLANKKNALSKMDEVFREYNMCCICQEPYDVDPDPADGTQNGADSGPRLPIKGKCGHDVCEVCLDMWYLEQCSGKAKVRYLNCPICKDKAFDVQNKVKDHFLCALIEAKQHKFDSDGENNQVIAKNSQQLPSELALLRKEFEAEKAQLRKKICEKNEQLEKLALENAQLKKRIEELESKPKAVSAGIETEDNDDSDIEDVEAVEVDVLSESASRTPNKSKEQVWWACSRCTLLNPSKRKTCQVCSGKRKC